MSTNPDIRVNIALGGAQQVSEEMARLQKAMQSYVTTAQQIPKLSPGVDLFTGASLKSVEALKKYDPPMRNVVSLAGQVAAGGRNIGASFDAIPSLASALGLTQVASTISSLRQVFTLVSGIAATAGGLATLGLGAAAFGGFMVWQKRRELDQKAEDATVGSVDANFSRLTKMAREKIDAGVIRDGPAKDIESLVAVINKGVLRMRDPRTFDVMGAAEDVQRMLKNLSGMLREDNQRSFAAEEEAALNHAQNRVAITREQVAAEQQLIQQKLNAVMSDERSSEQERIQAADLFATVRRSQIQSVAAAELDLIAEQEKQLRDQRARKDADWQVQEQIDNKLEVLANERVLVEKRITTEIQGVQTEHQSILAANREHFLREGLQKRIAAAQRENAEVRRTLQEMADMQAAADQRAQLNRTRIDTDFRVSEIERRRLRLQTIDAEIEAAEIQIELYRKMAEEARKVLKAKEALGLKPEELAVFEQRVGMTDNALRDAERRRDAIRIDRTGLENQANPESVEQQFASQWHQMRSATEQTARDLASIAMAPFQGMHAGLRDTLDQMMLQGGTFGDFMQGIWRGIGTSMRRALADGVANFVMNHVIMKGVALGWSAFKAALGWQEVNTANAQEAAKTPALATNATLASVGSFGVAAVVGLAAVAAILASVGAFADGGRIYGEGGPREDRVLARVSPGEYVINESAARAVGYDNLDMVNQGKLPVTAAPGATNVTAKSGDINLGLLMGPEMVEQYLESTRGRKIIVNIATGAKMELGMQG